MSRYDAQPESKNEPTFFGVIAKLMFLALLCAIIITGGEYLVQIRTKSVADARSAAYDALRNVQTNSLRLNPISNLIPPQEIDPFVTRTRLRLLTATSSAGAMHDKSAAALSKVLDHIEELAKVLSGKIAQMKQIDAESLDIKDFDTLVKRRNAVSEYLEAIRRKQGALTNFRNSLETELKRQDVPSWIEPSLFNETLQYEDPCLPIELQLCDSEQKYGSALLKIEDILGAYWGRWTRDPLGGTLRISGREGVEQYNAALAELKDASFVLRRTRSSLNLK